MTADKNLSFRDRLTNAGFGLTTVPTAYDIVFDTSLSKITTLRKRTRESNVFLKILEVSPKHWKIRILWFPEKKLETYKIIEK